MNAIGQLPVEHHMVADAVIVVLLTLLLSVAIAVRLTVAAGVRLVRLGRRTRASAGSGPRSA
jgi:hypothetical protein